MKLTNCKNCGAVLTGNKCEYCGTQYFDFCEVKPNKPVYIQVDKDAWIKAYAEVISCDYDPTLWFAPIYSVRFSGRRISKEDVG